MNRVHLVLLWHMHQPLYRDPGTGRSWPERDDFRPRTGAPAALAAALLLALAVLLLRRWRRALAGRLLPPAGRQLLVRVDEAGITAACALLAGAVALLQPHQT